MLAPIIHDRRLLGLLVLAHPISTPEFSDHDVELVRYVSSQLGDAIHCLRLRRQSLAPPQGA